jgi:hypothetical protein
MKHIVHNWVNLNTTNSKNSDQIGSIEQKWTSILEVYETKHSEIASKSVEWLSDEKGQSETQEITSLGRARMMVRVVMSSATLVPATSFSLSTLLRQPTTYRGPLLAFTITVSQKKSVRKLLQYINSHKIEQARLFTRPSRAGSHYCLQSSMC